MKWDNAKHSLLLIKKTPFLRFSFSDISSPFSHFFNHKLFICTHLTFHCVKIVRIRRYSGLHFSRIFPHSDWIQGDTEYVSIFSLNVGKMRTRITPNTDSFYAVLFMHTIQNNTILSSSSITYWKSDIFLVKVQSALCWWNTKPLSLNEF